ncbi:MAG: hypothetical protein A2Z31_09895 [candidate division NC10 bacterium RBG_16_65_8]|nr:MAG: hypothetical protein A2Z31_09895 [candidate division NC10 bacterium RBG_16_65_8]
MGASTRTTKDKTHRKASAPDTTKRKTTPKAAAGNKGKAADAVARQRLGRQVSLELLKLRPVVKEVGTALLDRLDGDLAGLALSLRGEDLHGESPTLPRPRVLSAMLADIQAVKVKPKKGRVKDLRRIEALLESLQAQMPSEA